VISKLHRLVGLLAVAVFILTGVFMMWSFPDLYQGSEVVRYMYRTNHVYILLSGLVNVALGTYLLMSEAARKRLLQYIGSGFALVAPAVLVIAFFAEPPQASPMKPLTGAGIFSLLIGTLCHWAGRPRPGVT
jgi:heme A synthase